MQVQTELLHVRCVFPCGHLKLVVALVVNPMQLGTT